MWTDRTEILVGKSGIEKLKNSHIIIVGIGGVGGFVCELLARAGIGELTIIDFDVVDETNINRQVVANADTVGKLKVEVMSEIIKKINPNCKVNAISERFCKENLQNFNKLFNSQNCSYVVDAIDDVRGKVELICLCKNKNIPIVSAMGAGNRVEIPQFKVMDIYQTTNDGLAKVMRRNLRQRNIDHLDVVTSQQIPLKTENTTVGSISYFPAMCGCVLSGYIVQQILSK